MSSVHWHKLQVAGVTILAGSMIWAAAPASADDVILPPGATGGVPGAIDCTPSNYVGVPLPTPCTSSVPSNETSFDTSNLPGMDISPGAARTATTFNLGPIIAALGPYASLAIFYVDFGDGTGFGSSGNPQALGSFPSSHVYVNPGTYTVTGYASMDGRTESTSALVTIAPPKEKPAAATATNTWDTTAAPSPQAVVPVTAVGLGGALRVGTAVSEIVERNSKPAARTEIKAPQVIVSMGKTTLVNIPSLPVGSTVTVQVKIGKNWTTLPATGVEGDGRLTLPALTFAKAGTYPVRLNLDDDTSRYVKVKVNKR